MRHAEDIIIVVATCAFAMLLTPVGVEAQCREQQLVPTNGRAGMQYGEAVAVDGDWLMVGAIGTGQPGEGGGKVYVYRREGNMWNGTQVLTPPQSTDRDGFGCAIVLTDGIAVIGADFAPVEGVRYGAAFVYKFSGQQWVLRQTLSPVDRMPFDHFGISIDAWGNRLLIGAWATDDNGPTSGSAYVYRLVGEEWAEEAKLLAEDGGMAIGTSVAISGDTAVVGARADDNENGENAGAAYVFRFRLDQWVQEQKILAPGGAANNGFGWAVDVDGPQFFASAPFKFNPPRPDGAVYVYRLGDNGWEFVQQFFDLDPSAHEWFGRSIVLNGTRAAIGSPMASGPGSVFLMESVDGQWVHRAKLSHGQGSERFGQSVSFDGRSVVGGAPFGFTPGGQTGYTYVHTFQPFECTPNIGLSIQCEPDGPWNTKFSAVVDRGPEAGTVTLRLDGDPDTDRLLGLDCDGRGELLYSSICPDRPQRVEIVECGVSSAVECSCLCDDLLSFKVTCSDSRLLTAITKWKRGHKDKIVTYGIGEARFNAPIKGKKAKFSRCCFNGPLEVALVEPPGCTPPKPVECPE